MATDTLRERVARAIYESHQFIRDWDDIKTKNVWRDVCLAEAGAAISLVLGEAAKVAEDELRRQLAEKEIAGWSMSAPAKALSIAVATAIRNLGKE